jgi:hypothetical protein
MSSADHLFWSFSSDADSDEDIYDSDEETHDSDEDVYHSDDDTAAKGTASGRPTPRSPLKTWTPSPAMRAPALQLRRPRLPTEPPKNLVVHSMGTSMSLSTRWQMNAMAPALRRPAMTTTALPPPIVTENRPLAPMGAHTAVEAIVDHNYASEAVKTTDNVLKSVTND